MTRHREIAFVSYDRETKRIHDVFLVEGIRHNYRWYSSHIRSNQPENSGIIVTTVEQFEQMPTRLVPFEGTYLENVE